MSEVEVWWRTWGLGNVNVVGDNIVGGLVGHNKGTVSNSYSTGSVSGSSDVGGLVGLNEGTVSNSFWDTQTSGRATSDGGTGETTALMKTQSTFTNAGWDFVNVWSISSSYNNGYPFLTLLPPTTTTTTTTTSPTTTTTPSTPPPEIPYAIYAGVISIAIVIVGLVAYLSIRKRRRSADTIRR